MVEHAESACIWYNTLLVLDQLVEVREAPRHRQQAVAVVMGSVYGVIESLPRDFGGKQERKHGSLLRNPRDRPGIPREGDLYVCMQACMHACMSV